MEYTPCASPTWAIDTSRFETFLTVLVILCVIILRSGSFVIFELHRQLILEKIEERYFPTAGLTFFAFFLESFTARFPRFSRLL